MVILLVFVKGVAAADVWAGIFPIAKTKKKGTGVFTFFRRKPERALQPPEPVPAPGWENGELGEAACARGGQAQPAVVSPERLAYNAQPPAGPEGEPDPRCREVVRA